MNCTLLVSDEVAVGAKVDGAGIGWRAGVEWQLTESWAVQTELTGGDSFDGFDLSDAVIDDINFESRVIRWFGDEFFGGFTIGSDFDAPKSPWVSLLGWDVSKSWLFREVLAISSL